MFKIGLYKMHWFHFLRKIKNSKFVCLKHCSPFRANLARLKFICLTKNIVQNLAKCPLQDEQSCFTKTKLLHINIIIPKRYRCAKFLI